MSRQSVLIALILAVGCGGGPGIDTQQVTARAVSGALPVEDPQSRQWDGVVEHPAKLMVQDVTEPRLVEPGVGLVRVRALHDGRWVVFRIEWEDATKDLLPESGRSSDAVAIQLPVKAGADVPDTAMGEAGKAVQLCYWKAAWQDDAERAANGGTDRVAALYLQASVDHYPFLAGGAARQEMEKRYAPAAAAGNPITVLPHAGPVQELVAEGFGTTTVSPKQQARGTGVWQSGRWMTTIARPLVEGEGQPVLVVGEKTYVAFAVWDGAAAHAGARKMRSGWIPLVLTP